MESKQRERLGALIPALAEWKMRQIVRLLILLELASVISACSSRRGNPGTTEAPEQLLALEQDILGDWIAGETYFAQPPIEVQQSIKSISFEAGNVIRWSYVSRGIVQQGVGRYVLLSNSSAKGASRKLPTLFVAPKQSKNPSLSSIILLKLTDLEIDFDARFPMESIGKVLKARESSGKPLLFVRSERKIGSQPLNTNGKKYLARNHYIMRLFDPT